MFPVSEAHCFIRLGSARVGGGLAPGEGEVGRREEPLCSENTCLRKTSARRGSQPPSVPSTGLQVIVPPLPPPQPRQSGAHFLTPSGATCSEGEPSGPCDHPAACSCDSIWWVQSKSQMLRSLACSQGHGRTQIGSLIYLPPDAELFTYRHPTPHTPQLTAWSHLLW